MPAGCWRKVADVPSRAAAHVTWFSMLRRPSVDGKTVVVVLPRLPATIFASANFSFFTEIVCSKVCRRASCASSLYRSVCPSVLVNSMSPAGSATRSDGWMMTKRSRSTVPSSPKPICLPFLWNARRYTCTPFSMAPNSTISMS